MESADEDRKKETTAQWFEIGNQSPAKKRTRKKEDKDEDKEMEAQPAEKAEKSQEDEAAPKSAPKGKSKGKGKTGTSDFAESIGTKKKLELMEMMVKQLARLAEIHDAELRDIMAATEMTIYVIPESHPAVDAMKDKYQTYMEWIEAKKQPARLAKTDFVSPVGPQPALLQAVLEKMLH